MVVNAMIGTKELTQADDEGYEHRPSLRRLVAGGSGVLTF